MSELSPQGHGIPDHPQVPRGVEGFPPSFGLLDSLRGLKDRSQIISGRVAPKYIAFGYPDSYSIG